MKILVVSDSHGGFNILYDIARKEAPDMVIHLGDGASDAESLGFATDREVMSVRGNCDFRSSLPDVRIIEQADKRFFICHGHGYGVKSGISHAVSAAKQNNCDILLFGHTHKQLYTIQQGIEVMNPGSARYGREYGVIMVDKGDFNFKLLHI